jgi:Protein of unknown function (DUF3800)
MKQRPGSSEFFVVTLVLFEDNDEAAACDQKIAQVRRALHLHQHFEFHFNSCSDKLRVEFLNAVSPCGFFYHSFVLNKAKLWGQGFRDKNSFYKYTTGLVFENAKPHLRQAKVVIDKRGNREFRKQLAKYLNNKINRSDPGSIIKRVSMEASHSNNLIQLADMLCGAVGRSFNLKKENRGMYRRIIQHREIRVQVWPSP